MRDTARYLAATPLGNQTHWHACPRVDRASGEVDGNKTLCGLRADPREWIYSAKYEITCPLCVARMKEGPT
ncbi:MAG TPA: hypothetical protein VGL91_04335 [Acidobacteriota bacterium]